MPCRLTLLEFMDDNQLKKAIILGHSMGGKVAMHFACSHAERISHLLILDIAPKSYLYSLKHEDELYNHKNLMETMLKFNFDCISQRAQIESKLSETIKNNQIRQFLLKNIKRQEDGTFSWLLNIESLYANLPEILDGSETYNNLSDGIRGFQTIFLKGSDSKHISPDDEELIRSIFPYAEIQAIPGAGHWLHAEQPELVIKAIYNFLEMETP
jgi:esterase